MSVYHPSEPRRNTLISTGEHRLMMVLTRVLTMRFHSSPSRGTPSTSMPDSSAPRSASKEPRDSKLHALNCQMLSHHFGAQLIALAGRHHRSFGHDDIFLSQSGGKMESLFNQ